MNRDVMNDCDRRHVYMAVERYKQIGRKHRPVKLAQVTLMETWRHERLPWTPHKLRKLLNELFTYRSLRVSRIATEPAYGQQSCVRYGQVRALSEVGYVSHILCCPTCLTLRKEKPELITATFIIYRGSPRWIIFATSF